MQSVGTLSTFKAKVQRKVSADAESSFNLTDDQWNDAIRDGVDLFNNHQPNRKVFEQAGDNTTLRFDLASLISEWKQQTSRVLGVSRVSSANTDEEEVFPYGLEDWRVERNVSNLDILFLGYAIGSSETLRLVYGQPHEVQDLDGATVTTVQDRWTETLALLCASFAMETIAARAAESSNFDLGANQVDFEQVHRRWLDVAKRRKNQALERIAPVETNESAGCVIEWRSRSKLSPEGRIGH